jgi:hypothetical protein
VVAELGAALEYVLDDGKQEPADAALEAARQRDAEDDTLATRVQSVSDYLVGIWIRIASARLVIYVAP